MVYPGCSDNGSAGTRWALRGVAALHVAGSVLVLPQDLFVFLLVLLTGVCGVRASCDPRRGAPYLVMSSTLLVYHAAHVMRLCQNLALVSAPAGSLPGAPFPALPVLLALAQMPWIPSMALWACSWTLGAGFSLGQGALVAPIGSSTGDLPTIPLLAAMSTGDAHPAMIAVWLLAGALAGAVGAHVCVRARHDDARRALPEREFLPDEGALYGLIVGVLAALLLCLLALLSHGALGTRRLTELGPLLGRLLVLAPTVLGAGGMLGGFATALRLGRGGNG